MKDRNCVDLRGIIGDDFRYGRTQDGKEYATFSLCINSYDKIMADGTERTHSQTYIRIFCYNKKQVEYLRMVNAHRGQRIYIDGRLSSYKNEYKGNTFMTLSVICRDLGIIQTNNNKIA